MNRKADLHIRHAAMYSFGTALLDRMDIQKGSVVTAIRRHIGYSEVEVHYATRSSKLFYVKWSYEPPYSTTHPVRLIVTGITKKDPKKSDSKNKVKLRLLNPDADNAIASVKFKFEPYEIPISTRKPEDVLEDIENACEYLIETCESEKLFPTEYDKQKSVDYLDMLILSARYLETELHNFKKKMNKQLKNYRVLKWNRAPFLGNKVFRPPLITERPLNLLLGEKIMDIFEVEEEPENGKDAIALWEELHQMKDEHHLRLVQLAITNFKRQVKSLASSPN